MLSLPLPILAFALSAIACVLVWQASSDNALARIFFTVTFAIIALGTLLTGLRFGYGFEQLTALQRAIPMFVGPVVFLGFSAFFYTARRVMQMASVHLGAATLVVFAFQVWPENLMLIDLLISASYLFYSVSLLIYWRRGEDQIALAPIGMATQIQNWIAWAAGMLFLMSVVDLIIAIYFAMRRPQEAISLISVGSVVILAGLVTVIFMFFKNTRQTTPLPKPVITEPEETYVALEKEARSLLIEKQLYLDTELTLDRLARRLHVPARTLSEAINQTQGLNVSQYVNNMRLTHAATLLETTNLSVKNVLEQSGFLTRSNFYREFERLYTCSPTQFRKQNKATNNHDDF